MALSMGLGSSPVGWLELVGKSYWLVADSEGGFWTSRDEERSQSWDDRWCWLRWEDGCKRGRGVYPRLQITGARARGIVDVG